MIRNYCIIAWRNLRKFGVYSVINLVGLSIGIAVSLMILLQAWLSNFPCRIAIPLWFFDAGAYGGGTGLARCPVESGRGVAQRIILWIPCHLPILQQL
jgi:hypothetical protein